MSTNESDDGLVRPFRLAFRKEGSFVCCYLADLHTMEGAQLLGMIPKPALDADPTIWADYQTLMQRVLSVACKGVLGFEPVKFESTRAPEHERSGHG